MTGIEKLKSIFECRWWVELRPWLRQNQTNLNVCYQDTFFVIGEFTVSAKIYFFDGPFGEPEFNL